MTPLTHTLKRALTIQGRPFVITLTPESLKVTPKGKRKGVEISWDGLVSGAAALSVALNASVGAFPAEASRRSAARPRKERKVRKHA